jgi:hypothetical protein
MEATFVYGALTKMRRISPETPKRRCDWKAQTACLARQEGESIVFVEALGGFVFGVHNHGKHAQLRPRHAHQGISQEHTAQTLALVATVDGEPPQQRGRSYRIAWQFLRDDWRQIVQWNGGGREGIVAGYGVRPNAHGDETRRNAPFGIL